MSLLEMKDGQVVLNIGELETIMCKCGHSVMTHYFAEGCCDRSRCDCLKFEQEPGE